MANILRQSKGVARGDMLRQAMRFGRNTNFWSNSFFGDDTSVSIRSEDTPRNRMKFLPTVAQYITVQSPVRAFHNGKNFDLTFMLQVDSMIAGYNSWDGIYIYWGTEGDPFDSSVGYQVQCMTDGWQISYNGTFFADYFAEPFVIGGAPVKVRIVETDTGFDFYLNDVLKSNWTQTGKPLQASDGYLTIASSSCTGSIWDLRGCQWNMNSNECTLGVLVNDFDINGCWRRRGGGDMQVEAIPKKILTISSRSFGVTSYPVNMTKGLALNAYTVSVTTAAFAMAANTVGLLAGRRVTISAQTYAAAMNTVNLLSGRRLTVATRTYAAGTNPVNLLAGRKVTVTAAALAMAANSVGLNKGYRITVTVAGAAISTKPVGLYVGRRLTVSTASYAVSGNNVNLVYGKNYLLTVTTASVAVAANSVNLLAARRVTVTTRAFSAGTFPVGLYRGSRLSVTPAAINTATNGVNLLAGRRIVISPAAFAETTNSTGLYRSRILSVSPASFAVATQSVNMFKTTPGNYVLLVQPASFVVASSPVTLTTTGTVGDQGGGGTGNPMMWSQRGRR